MYTKMIIVVDESVNVHNYLDVAAAVNQNVIDPSHLIITEGPLDALDHASNRAFQGFRLGIDATIKRVGESDATYKVADANASALSALKVIGYNKHSETESVHAYLNRLAQDASQDASYVIVVDEWIDTTCLSTVSWKVFNNIDPDRDLVITKHINGRLFVGIDATKKGPSDGLMRPWPDDIEMSDEIKTRVTKRWSEYGLD